METDAKPDCNKVVRPKKPPKWRAVGHPKYVYQKEGLFTYDLTATKGFMRIITPPILCNNAAEAFEAASVVIKRKRERDHKIAILGPHSSCDERIPAAVAKRTSVKKNKKDPFRPVRYPKYVYQSGNQFAYHLGRRIKFLRHVFPPIYFDSCDEAFKAATAELKRREEEKYRRATLGPDTVVRRMYYGNITCSQEDNDYGDHIVDKEDFEAAMREWEPREHDLVQVENDHGNGHERKRAAAMMETCEPCGAEKKQRLS